MSGVVNICQMVACFWSLWGMGRFGRRPLLFGGAACMVVSHLIIAILMSNFRYSWPSHTAGAWTCVAFLCFYMLTYGATWGPILWAMPAEIFPTSVRAKGVAYATMLNWLNNVIVGLITPPLIQNPGYGTYVFFCSFVSSVLCHLFGRGSLCPRPMDAHWRRWTMFSTTIWEPQNRPSVL